MTFSPTVLFCRPAYVSLSSNHLFALSLAALSFTPRRRRSVNLHTSLDVQIGLKCFTPAPSCYRAGKPSCQRSRINCPATTTRFIKTEGRCTFKLLLHYLTGRSLNGVRQSLALLSKYHFSHQSFLTPWQKILTRNPKRKDSTDFIRSLRLVAARDIDGELPARFDLIRRNSSMNCDRKQKYVFEAATFK